MAYELGATFFNLSAQNLMGKGDAKGDAARLLYKVFKVATWEEAAPPTEEDRWKARAAVPPGKVVADAELEVPERKVRPFMPAVVYMDEVEKVFTGKKKRWACVRA